MKEERITVVIASDGALRAETRGLKGSACEVELEALLSEIASINEVRPTAEAREKEPEAHTTRTARVTKGKP